MSENLIYLLKRTELGIFFFSLVDFETFKMMKRMGSGVMTPIILFLLKKKNKKPSQEQNITYILFYNQNDSNY